MQSRNATRVRANMKTRQPHSQHSCSLCTNSEITLRIESIILHHGCACSHQNVAQFMTMQGQGTARNPTDLSMIHTTVRYVLPINYCRVGTE